MNGQTHVFLIPTLGKRCPPLLPLQLCVCLVAELVQWHPGLAANRWLLPCHFKTNQTTNPLPLGKSTISIQASIILKEPTQFPTMVMTVSYLFGYLSCYSCMGICMPISLLYLIILSTVNRGECSSAPINSKGANTDAKICWPVLVWFA